MLKKMLVAAVAMGVMATAGLADVTLSYSPSEFDIAEVENGPLDIAVSLTSNPGTDALIASIGFEYDDGSDGWAGLNPQGFEWTFEGNDNPNTWFVSGGLPSPAAVAFVPGVEIDVPDGTTVEIATLAVRPEATGDFVLNSNVVNLTDANLLPLSLKGGDPTTISVTPEPASLGLLALGALAMIRRRR